MQDYIKSLISRVNIFCLTGTVMILTARPVTSLGYQGAKSFLRVTQIFQTMSNTFKLCPAYFSKVGEKFSRGGFAPLGYGPANR